MKAEELVPGMASVDQSVLTGESLEVGVSPGGHLYAGSIMRRGEATGEVTATAAHTYFGRTAELVRTAQTANHLEETIFGSSSGPSPGFPLETRVIASMSDSNS